MRSPPFVRGDARMADRVGQQLGNYRLAHLLGRGNFSEVYLGKHIHLNTLAAIKVLYAQLANHGMEGFLTEARTIAHLRHPHIIQVLDFGVEAQTPFLVGLCSWRQPAPTPPQTHAASPPPPPYLR